MKLKPSGGRCPIGASDAGGLGFGVEHGEGGCARGGLRPRPVRAPLFLRAPGRAVGDGAETGLGGGN
jgi:hypothetical protein